MTRIKKKGNIAVGEKISKLRNELNMTRATLAEIIGVSVFTMLNMESGKTGTKSARLVKLAEALKVSLSYLISFKDDVPTSGLQNSLDIAKSKLKEQDLLILELQSQIISVSEKLYD